MNLKSAVRPLGHWSRIVVTYLIMGAIYFGIVTPLSYFVHLKELIWKRRQSSVATNWNDASDRAVSTDRME